MATHGRLSRFLPPLIPIATDNTLASPGPARIKVASIVIATRNEIVAAGIAALVQADGHSVAARCANEDDLLRRLEASSNQQGRLVWDYRTANGVRVGSGVFFARSEGAGASAKAKIIVLR